MRRLNELYEKYNVNVKNTSSGNLKSLENTISELEKLDKVLLLSCSNRYNWDPNKIDIPKSTILAMIVDEYLGNKSTFIDVPELKIYPCEGNVSRAEGNSCGLKKAELKDKNKNPSGHHRCWASINFKDDELWKISKELLESNAVVFFASVRWGQASVFYQQLIERLTWLENRHASLGESNLLENIQSGFICTGQNWNGLDVVDTQRKVHYYYGFKPNDKLYWNWQFTSKITDETEESYKEAFPKFVEKFDIKKLF